MKYLREYIPYIVIIIVVILIRTFIVTPIIVNGESMDHTLKDGEIMILNKIKPAIYGYKRFQIVVIKTGKTHIIKRIIGLPGETISYEEGILYINGKKTEDPYAGKYQISGVNTVLADDEYFVLGDNRAISKDSRYSDVGNIKEKDIMGNTKLVIFPFNKFGYAEYKE